MKLQSAIETRKRGFIPRDDVSDVEEEVVAWKAPEGGMRKVVPTQGCMDDKEKILFRAMSKTGRGVQMEVPWSFGTLNAEELIDWLAKMENYFEFNRGCRREQDVDSVNQVERSCCLMVEEVQLERNRKGKDNITHRECMDAKLKGKFFLGDYQLDLLKKLQNLQQNELSVKEYTWEFYKITIQVGHSKMDQVKAAQDVGLQDFECLHVHKEDGRRKDGSVHITQVEEESVTSIHHIIKPEKGRIFDHGKENLEDYGRRGWVAPREATHFLDKVQDQREMQHSGT
ncbi:hypothetical protein KI387_011522 [Taxus chinensis]|uniref:Retrotransposon gag domain-containing protein n=1 Tax=Taxus chinensis TaxID=29808 RepID=A0AA38CNT6_TAXCH|nr:hypothetical protein KI387_011522 [Taxus chinensis]